MQGTLLVALYHGIVPVIDNQLEAHVLQPFVVGRYVKIHPLAVVLGPTVGALTIGAFGAIIAIPLIACIKRRRPVAHRIPGVAGRHGPRGGRRGGGER